MELDDTAVVNNKLNIVIRKDRLEEIGLLGQLFTDLTQVMQKLRALKFTDVELSLLSAIVLFCPGRLQNHLIYICFQVSNITILQVGAVGWNIAIHRYYIVEN